MTIAMWEQFRYYIIYAISFMIATISVTNSLKHRNKNWIFLIIHVGISVVLSLFFGFLLADLKTEDRSLYKMFSPIVFFVLASPSIFYIFFMLKEKIATKLFMFVSAALVYNTSTSIYNVIFFAYADLAKTGFYEASKTPGIWLYISLLCKIIWFILAYFFFRKYASINKNFKMNYNISIFFAIALLSNFLISPLVNNKVMPTNILFRINLGLLCYHLITLGMIFIFSVANDSQIRMMKLSKSISTSIKEYEITKENIEIINQKCHDMRHQIRIAQQSSNLNEDYVNDALKSIEIYDNSIKTGNDVLDVILTNIKLRCSANDITLNVIADGKLMDFMREDHLISLFSNLLENATNFESRVNDKEKRYICMKIFQWNSFIKVHCENYFTLDVESEEVKDKNYHGFGIESMKAITKRYGGTFSSSQKDNYYTVDILFNKK